MPREAGFGDGSLLNRAAALAVSQGAKFQLGLRRANVA
jgi:hypothetical protein